MRLFGTCVLFTNLDDENQYIVYFKKFLELYGYPANVEMPSKCQLIEECQLFTNTNDVLTNNHSKVKTRRSKTTKRHSSVKGQCRPILNNHNMDAGFQAKLTFKGGKKERKRLRCRLLNDICLGEQTEPSYGYLIEQLIDLEDSLLE